MPHDVIMPALGMAQDTGLIVAWHKAEGDEVEAGDVLFEVETDKATMEVEASAGGFLIGVSANAGENVPVGEVIAQIAKEQGAQREAQPADMPAPAKSQDLPEGHEVIMPTLGMAQDTGLLVNWLKSAGNAVKADDPLFEVETDKSTMEVPAGADGFLAAILAQKGENVPVGEVIAVISQSAVEAPIERAFSGSGEAKSAQAVVAEDKPVASANKEAEVKPSPQMAAAMRKTPSQTGKVLTSPKARKIAHDQGVSLEALRKAGLAEPMRAQDVAEYLEKKSAKADAPAVTTFSLQAKVKSRAFDAFLAWSAEQGDGHSEEVILASFAAAALGERYSNIAISQYSNITNFECRSGQSIQAQKLDDFEGVADLTIFDLRNSFIETVQSSAVSRPQITLARKKKSHIIILQAPATLAQNDAMNILQNFAARLENPLRHLL